MMVQAQESKTAEGRIFNEVILLLCRQREEAVTKALLELKSQLDDIYHGKTRPSDYAMCQMGLALIDFGLGDHDEARRLGANAQKICGGEEHIVSNAMVMFSNMGDLEAAHRSARDTWKHATGNITILKAAAGVFERALDFGAMAECIDAIVNLESSEDQARIFAARKALAVGLASRAEHAHLSPKDLLARATCAVRAIQSNDRKIFWIALRGSHPNAVTLEFQVNAPHDVCAELNFAVADALTSQFNDTGVDVITMAVRSYPGSPQFVRSIEISHA
ncbi:hypothetical protein [Trinickia sp. EG282A]|uniref:hypothetical protein n=1 Tax=Trinickia sp. EG282A TaxID=3237013 RepID=UPI0034D333C4